MDRIIKDCVIATGVGFALSSIYHNFKEKRMKKELDRCNIIIEMDEEEIKIYSKYMDKYLKVLEEKNRDLIKELIDTVQ